MPRTAPLVPVFALAGWTVFVWTTRIGNIWRDDAASASSKVASTALALSFTVLAVAVAAAAWRRAWAVLRPSVLGLAAWTTGVWLVRSATILAGDRSAGFKVVHGVLAVVSIALAAWAVRSVRSHPEASDADSRYATASGA